MTEEFLDIITSEAAKTEFAMKSGDCSSKARQHIDSVTRRRIAQYSRFGCSICGAIPIVFHHIEEWAKKLSNEEKYLIPICDKCHRGIHGEGGVLFSRDELYEYKANPIALPFLSDKLPLERKNTYSFFIGSNFIADGIRKSFFSFTQKHNLLSIDTSSGSLLLSLLSEIKDGEPLYLLRNNELMIDTIDIWDMRYSRNSLKIWRITEGEKTVFIDFVIKAEEKVIILREMNTTFDGKPFRIYRYRKPQERQVQKIRDKVKQYEEQFYRFSSQKNERPRMTNEVIIGIDFATSREMDKLKSRIEHVLNFEFWHEFTWDWSYYQWVLGRVLAESPVFASTTDSSHILPGGFKPESEKVASIKKRYMMEFEELEGTVVEYDGVIWQGNIKIRTS